MGCKLSGEGNSTVSMSGGAYLKHLTPAAAAGVTCFKYASGCKAMQLASGRHHDGQYKES